MRKLAHIEKIEWKRPIEGADRIELVGVLGWQCIAKKDEFAVGDLCVYIEIDSIVDKTNPDFEFLEKRNYKIKTMKMKGVLSQGIVFPLTLLHFTNKVYNIGDDALAIVIVHHMHHLSFEKAGSLHESLVDGDATHIIEVGLGNSHAVQLGFQHL